MSSALIIRPARPEDRPAVERICAHTWEWGDYIPEVWEEWLADKRGVQGARIHDLLHARAARLGGADVILTRDTAFNSLGEGIRTEWP